jgi:hypothetical protein
VSERRVRLLITTSCWTCGEPVAAGTTTWWDDDRHHATCTDCYAAHDDQDAEPDAAGARPILLDARTRRRIEIRRAQRSRVTQR